MDHHPFAKLLDGSALAVIASTLVGWLPSIAAIGAIAWYGVQIYDRFFANRNRKSAIPDRQLGE